MKYIFNLSYARYSENPCIYSEELINKLKTQISFQNVIYNIATFGFFVYNNNIEQQVLENIVLLIHTDVLIKYNPLKARKTLFNMHLKMKFQLGFIKI